MTAVNLTKIAMMTILPKQKHGHFYWEALRIWNVDCRIKEVTTKQIRRFVLFLYV